MILNNKAVSLSQSTPENASVEGATVQAPAVEEVVA